MHISKILAAAVLALGLMACKDVTAPKADTVTVVKTKTDTVVVQPPSPTSWQVVVESQASANVWVVAADRANPFTGLTIDGFDVVTPSLVIKQAKGDTAYIGIAAALVTYSFDFTKKSLMWTVNSDLTTVSNPASTKVAVGKVASLYELQKWVFYMTDDGFFIYPEGLPSFGKPTLSVIGNDFQFADKVKFDDTRESALQMVVLFYVPIVCSEPGARKLSSVAVADMQTDSSKVVKNKRPFGNDITITCNPGISADASIAAAPRVSLRSVIASQRPEIRK